ncbi:hypothetical protein HHK36_003751 [Tetracentron sinense]|uniref:Bromo domain-containing protein n=1 Tax=Tetracentron sinense TaxID=13715 RepID=A0A834ZRN8_TETSI|nr:hypothetical protein HHK36_003751 [Tetracentron sinense]
MMRMEWGTLEELLLGGAVLRHGTRAWDAVAAELRTRILCPCTFSAKVNFSPAWFEELRKQRVAELKRELEKSKDSIGSLESKLENLKAEKRDDCQVDFDSSRTESEVPLGNSDGLDFSGKATSKDVLSAGSFTKATRTIPSPESPTPTTSVQNPAETTGGGHAWCLTNRRGKRKRKDFCKEACAGENSLWVSSTAVLDKESTSGREPNVRSADVADPNGHFHLMRIFNSILDHENASVFRPRLNNKKKAKYEKTILRHMDFDTIRSRIVDRSISSSKELYRDLVLIADNALVFYPKHSREYKSALPLRDLIVRTFRQCGKDSGDNQADNPMLRTLVKPRSVRPCNGKLNGKVADFEKYNAVTPSPEDKKACDAESQVDSSAVAKRGVGRPRKAECGSARKRPETPAKGIKGSIRAS